MKILMQCRSSLYRLGGGDRVQLESTAQALRNLGHEVTIANHYVQDLGKFDVVHLFNMQIEPHSFFIYTLRAKQAGKPVALSTIYWNPDEWKQHDQTPAATSGRRPLDRIKALLSYKFNGVPPWRLANYFMQNRSLRHWFQLAFTRPSSGEATNFIKQQLIESVDIILPNGTTEAEQVSRDFAKPQRWLFVPNGVTDEFKAADPKAFTGQYGLKDFVLSVGRIESRKNVLDLAKACKELGLQLVLIGNDQVEPDYAEAVKAAGGNNLLVIPEMAHDQLGAAYAAAKIHALASWFETPGISSLEAAVAGCNIVTTEIGTTREYFGNLAYYCNPADYGSIVAALKAAAAGPKSDKLSRHILANFTWEDAAKATLKAYQMIGVKP